MKIAKNALSGNEEGKSLKNLISLGILGHLVYAYLWKDGIIKIARSALMVMKGQKVDKLYRVVGNTIVGGVIITISCKMQWRQCKIKAYAS